MIKDDITERLHLVKVKADVRTLGLAGHGCSFLKFPLDAWRK